MNKILVLFDNTLFYWKWLLPLKWCKKELKQTNVVIKFDKNIRFKILINLLFKNNNRFIYKVNYLKRILEKKHYEIIALSFHYKNEFFRLPEEEKKAIFGYLRKHCDKIIWLDPSDSTGTATFNILPYVDIYLKKQLLSNISLYTKPIYGDRLYAEYYHDKYHLNCGNEIASSNSILKEEYIYKIGVSWNVGIGSISIGANKYANILKDIIGFKNKFKDISLLEFNEKKYKLFYNGTLTGEPAVSYQRRRTHELINLLSDDKCVSPKERIDRSMYLKMMYNSKIIISPFGFGEICFRDFEAFIFGGCLLKPNMLHLNTWPNYFIDDKTYKKINWDFSDFNNAIECLKSDEKNIKEISENGRYNFLKYSLETSEGRQIFSNHILEAFRIG